MAMSLEEIEQIVERLEITLGDVQTDVAGLYDLMNFDIRSKRTFQRNRQLVERLVVEAFRLDDAKQLITPSQRAVLPEAKRYAHLRKENRLDLSLKGAELSVEVRVRLAQIVMYYLLIKHDMHASYRVMHSTFGFNPKWLFPSLRRLATDEPLFLETLNQIERRLLDAMGLLDHPVLPIPSTLIHASNHKAECKRLKIPYHYADHAQG